MIPNDGMMDRMMNGGWDGGDVLSGVVLIVPVVVLILAAVLMGNQRRREGPGDGRHIGESPRDILDRRYAAG